MNHEHQHELVNNKKTTSRAKWVFTGFLFIAAYFLVTEHRAHLSGWLSSYGIWLLVLACPLMHLFMHGGHDHKSRDSSKAPNESTKENK
jgi:Protein of unknown function (DUF2933)